MNNCTKCGESKDAHHFQLYKGKPAGQCRSCKTEAMKKLRAAQGISVRKFSTIMDGRKLCMHCNQMVSIELFSPSKRGLGGISAYCKPCTLVKFKPTKEEMKNRTANYRKNNKPRWLSLHRLAQFRRRCTIAITSDGTVTDEFLYSIYETEFCYYCHKLTERSERTADHKTPLIKGGGHTASNLVMACFSCNSSKSSKTEKEFLLARNLK